MIFLPATVLECVPHPVFLIDECGVLRHVNEKACRLLGYETAEMCGLLFAELDVSLPIGEWEYYHRRVISGQTGRAEEHLFLTRGGQVVRVAVEATRHEADGRSLVLLIARPCHRTAGSGVDADERLRFMALLENIPGSVVRFDAEQRVSYASHELERKLGAAPGSLVGARLQGDAWAWTVPLRKAVASALESGEPQEVILEAGLPEGRFTDTMHVVPVRNARGAVDGALCYAETAAERLLSEAASHSTEEPWREIFQHAPDGLFLLGATDAGGFMVLDANPAFARFVGRTRGELTGRRLDDIMPAHLANAHSAKFLRCMEAGERTEEQGRLQAAIGPIWYSTILTPLRDADGRIFGVIGIFRDIAEKMHMKVALQESEQRYREIVERSTDSIYLLEVTGDGHFRALGANPAFEAIFGIRREDVIGRLLEEIVPGRLARMLNARYVALVENGVQREDRIEVELPVGRRRVQSTLVPMKDAEGKVRRIMVISRNLPIADEQDCEMGATERAAASVRPMQVLLNG